MSPERWEHFPHEADMGVRGYGATKAGAFAQAALALSAVVTELNSVQPREEVTIACEAPDDETLLVDWLNAVVFEMATRKMLFVRFQVDLMPQRLHAKVWGEPVDIARHERVVEIKGATFTELRVAPTNDGGWLAQCVVDV